MASYTDNPNIKFNPYIQQLPVEAMVSVGMQKQAQYEQGLQKIQTSINNVAGLDIYKDLDKNYLQTKMNELGSKLKTVAAGDFSNFQLVNSVTGMTGQLVKDPNIQNAVYSTANHKKQLAYMEDAKSKGTLTPQNKRDYDRQFNNYANSDVVGDKFSGEYTPFMDYKKQWNETLKTLHSKLTEQDITNVMDANGNIDRTRLAAAMTRVKDEGVSSVQIENAIRSELSPSQLNQMRIDANYQFENVTNDQLQKAVTTQYDSTLKTINDKITFLEGYAKINTSNPKEFDKANQSINDLKESISNLTDNYNGQSKRISEGDVEGTKLELFKNSSILQYANSRSWENKSMTKMNNPELDAQYKEKEYKLSIAKFNLDKNKTSWGQYIDLEKLKLEQQKVAVDIQAKNPGGGLGGATTYFGGDTNIKDPLTSMQSDAIDAQTSFNQTINDYAASKKISPAQAQIIYNKYINGDKKSLGVEWHGLMNQAHENETLAVNLNATLKKTKDDISKNPSIKKDQLLVQQEVAKMKGLVFKQNGVDVKIPNSEFFNFLVKIRPTYKPGIGFLDKTNKSELNQRELIMYNALKSGNRGVLDLMTSYQGVVDASMNINSKINKSMSDVIAVKGGLYIPSISEIIVSAKDGTRESMENKADMFLQKFNSPFGGTAGGTAELSNSDAKLGRDLFVLKDKSNLKYYKITQGEKNFLQISYGSKDLMIPLTDNEANELPANPNLPNQREKRITQTQTMGDGNTNITNSPTNALYKQRNFSQIRSLIVSANLTKDKTPGSAKQYMDINIKLPSGWHNVQLSDFPLDISSSDNAVSNLTDKQIKDLFLNNRDIKESVKKEIRELN